MRNALLVLGLTASVALAQIVVLSPSEVGQPSATSLPASSASQYGKVQRVAQQEAAPMEEQNAGTSTEASATNAPGPSIDTLADDPDAGMSQAGGGTLSATPAVIHRGDGTNAAASQVLPPTAKYQPSNAPAVQTTQPVAPATAPASAVVTVAPNAKSAPVTVVAPPAAKTTVTVQSTPAPTPSPVVGSSAVDPKEMAAAPKPAASVPVAASDRILFQLKDLAMLSRAARMAGGSLKVSIQPVGIHVSDLIEPLRQMGYFDVAQDASNRLVVRTRQQDPVTARLQNQIQKLRSESLRLLDEIHSLEKTRAAVVAAPAPAAGGMPASYSGGQGEPVRLRQNEEAQPQATPVVLQPKLQ